jgi:hypothetical protein
MVLDHRNVEHIQIDPYRIFRVNGVYDEGFSQNLSSTFPGENDIAWFTNPKGNKRYLSNDHPSFFAFLAKHNEWRALYEFFASEGTIEFLYNLVRDGNVWRPGYQRKPWRISHDIRAPLLHSKTRRLRMILRNRVSSRVQVRYGFEFSSLGEDASIPPHTDSESKLLSLMLYFPRPGAEVAPVGTEFYAPRQGRAWSVDWNTGLLGEQEQQKFFKMHETFYQTEFVSNVLYGFVKSDRSWHGLKPVEKEYTPRRSVNINYFLDE